MRSMNKKVIVPYIFLLPALFLWYFLSLYPIIISFYYSFFEWDGFPGHTPVFVGLANYIDSVHDIFFISALQNTFIWAFFCVVVAVGAAIVLGAAINFKVVGHKFIRVALFLPWMIPVSSSCFIWRYIIYSPGGLLDTFLKTLGLDYLKRGWLSEMDIAIYMMIVVALWVGTGIQVLILSSAMGNVSPELYDSAKVDGANLIQRFANITLPLISRAIMMSISLVLCGALTMFTYPYLLSAGATAVRAQFLTLALLVYQQSFLNFKIGKGFATAWLMILLEVGLAYYYIRRVTER